MLKLLEDMNELYITTGYTDMRKQIDGLSAIITITYGKELEEGSLFLFCGRRADRLKGLFWDGTGYILVYKRLSNSRFQWPRNETELKKISTQEFRWLMEGLSIYQSKSIKHTEQKPLF